MRQAEARTKCTRKTLDTIAAKPEQVLGPATWPSLRLGNARDRCRVPIMERRHFPDNAELALLGGSGSLGRV